MGEKMKILNVILLITLLLLAVGCDTELGHRGENEDHDHDGDGIQDHAPEDHMNEDITENENFLVIKDMIN
jgi:hypothetical protein